MPPELPPPRLPRSDTVAHRLARLEAELAGAAWIDTDDEHTRIRPPDPPTRPAAPVLPVPGRHAARRSAPPADEAFPDLVPEPATLRGRVRLGAPQLAVVSVVVALGLLVTAWWTVRGRSTGEVVPPVAVASLATPAARSSPSPVMAGATASGRVVVDVAGRVRRPGIVVLPSGSRVVDALREAGGARPRVDLAGLNQARVLVDGEQIVVGQAAAPGLAASAASSAGSGAGGPLVDLNTADQPGLEELPGVGPVTAQAIIAWRTEHGGFTSVDDLLEVDGIGEKTLADLAPLVTI